jgi:ELWxxDGT repeat protein
MNPSIRAVSASLTLFSGLALAQGPAPDTLVDLETVAEALGSEPGFGATLPGIGCIFAADDAVAGRELWLLPDNGGAPQLLKDIHVGSRGSHPDDFVVFQGEVWFSASDGVAGRELWRTDGTAAGTVLAVDVAPGAAGSAPAGLTVCGADLFFTAFAAGAGREPHRTNGAAASTILLADLQPGPRGSLPGSAEAHRFVCCGGQVLFCADDGATGDELYVSDGTAVGTALVVDLNPGADNGVVASEPPVCCNGELFFRGNDGVAGTELFATDGTAANTRLVRDLQAGGSSSAPTELTCFGSQVVFSANGPGVGRELHVSDGTTAGTALLVDLRPGAASSNPHDLIVCAGRLVFGASGDSAFDEPWASDGTAAGTLRLADLAPGTASSLLRETVCCGALVFFRARSAATGEELFVTDGTPAGTQLVVDLLPGADGSQPTDLFCCGARLLCSANGPDGPELTVSDGTAAGTVVHDLVPIVGTAGSRPRSVRPIDAVAFYFVAETQAHGEEVFFFDGQSASPIEVVPGPDDGNPARLTIVGRTAYWTANANGIGTELYRSTDGGPAELVADIRSGPLSSSPQQLIAFDHQTLVCTAVTTSQGREIVVARNGVAGVQVFDVRPGGSSSFAGELNRIIDPDSGANLVVFGANDGVHGAELFAYDGTTVDLLLDLVPGASGSGPQKFSAARDETSLLFTAFVGGSTKVLQLTVDDGTDIGGNVAVLFDTGGSFLVVGLANFLGFGQVVDLILMMEAFFNNLGEEPYALDAAGQAQLVQDVNLGAADAEIEVEEFHFVDGKWVASGTSVDAGNELRLLTSAQVEQVDLLEGGESSSPDHFVQVGGSVVFSASGSVAEDRVVYELDENGVVALFDGELQEPQVVGSTIVGGLWSPQDGNELVRFAAPGASNQVVGVPCDGRSRLLTTPARVGQPVEVRQIGGDVGDLGFVLLGGQLGPAVAALGCWLHVDPSGTVVAAAGAAPGFEGSFVVPSDTSLVGVAFATQGAWLRQNGSITLTNAVYSGIGQ